MCGARSIHRVRSCASFVRASVCSALLSASVSVSAGDGVGSSKAWPESEYKLASEKHHIETKYREDLMKAGHQRERRERERVQYARAHTRGERERVQGIRTSIRILQTVVRHRTKVHTSWCHGARHRYRHVDALQVLGCRRLPSTRSRRR